MKNLTRQFRRAMADDERVFLAYADITLANNTVLNLTNEEIWGGGFSYEEAVSEDDNFTAVGSVVIGSAEVVINNIYEEYSQYDFKNANVVLYIGMQFEDRLEKIKIGTYQVDDAVYNGATVRLSLLDNIEQFDRPYSTSTLGYPATLFQIVQEACTKCGVTLANNSQTFPHYQYTISTKPDGESLTFREVLSWCATLAGCFVKCNPNGELVFGWFDTTLLDESASDLDGGTFNPWSAGDLCDGGDLHTDRNVHYITGLWSQNIAMDDVVITGVTAYVKDDSENATQDILQYSTGTNGYKIEISDNEFITKTNAQEIVNWLGQQLIGLRFRKLNVSQLSDPSIDAGDVGIVIDRKQNVYRILVTRVAFSVSGDQTIVCGAATPSRNNATKYTSMTKSYVESRKQMKQERSAREQAVEQLEQAIAESAGLYTTIVAQQTGGNIYYMHDTPDLIDAKVVWKMTSNAWAVTDDWQGTDAATTAAHKWNAGLTVDGTLIASILSANGVNADWINVGTITIGGTTGNKNGSLIIKDANGNTIGTFNKDGISVKAAIQSNSTISGASISGTTVSGGTITGTTITGGTVSGTEITAGGPNTVGKLVVKNSSGTRVGLINGNGMYFGNIAGTSESPTIPGFYVNTSGRLIIRDTSNNIQTHIFSGRFDYRNKNSGYDVDMVIDTYGTDGGKIDSEIRSYNGALRLFGNDSVYANGILIVKNTKARLVDTNNYGERLLYCYETPTPYFGDIGTGRTDENGEAVIDIDDIFDETVNTYVEYSVFLQKEGQGDLWVDEKDTRYFVVKGTPNLKFSWEIKVVQSGFETLRLDDDEIRGSSSVTNEGVGLNLDQDLEDLDNEILFDEVI